MTEAQARQKYLNVLRGWLGRKESDGSHKTIIDTYNSLKPLPRNYHMSYSDAWCAATVSAAAIEAGMTDIIPRECSCARMIELFRQKGRWQENDAYVPVPGDILFYDWQDTGRGDNAGAPDHVGVVETCTGGQITVIEGNYYDSVRRRTLAVNGRYIRGYGLPDYAAIAAALTPAAAVPAVPAGLLAVGGAVRFTGNTQYLSSYADADAVNASPGIAAVSIIREGRAHPYHLEGPTVNGWVNAADLLDPGYNVRVRVSDFLNVRSGPGTGYEILRRLYDGDAVTVVEQSGQWGRLLDGGWVCLAYTTSVNR